MDTISIVDTTELYDSAEKKWKRRANENEQKPEYSLQFHRKKKWKRRANQK